MSGALEELITIGKALNDKLDKVIEIYANGGGTPPSTAETDKPKRGRPAKTDEKPVSSFTDTQVRAEVDRVKALPGAQAEALKKLISNAGESKLADLCTKPEKFDDFMAALKDYETGLSAAGDDPDDL